MLDVMCVCRSGGVYDAEWVRKLRDGVARHMKRPYRFRCLSDIEVPCERVSLEHDWPGWWAKIELFRPGLIENPTLYLDLDTIVVGPLDDVARTPVDFAMLSNFWVDGMVGSGVMWFSGENVPTRIYEKFARQPGAYMEHDKRTSRAPFIGDQVYIWETLKRNVDYINDYFPRICSYNLQCKRGIPPDMSLICFHGKPRPCDVDDDWMKEHWC